MERPQDVTHLAAGVVIGGGYRILRPLAEGGMGTVYEAEQMATGARRALKVMHGHFARDEGLRARFVREARLAASIPSEHVAQVLDAGQDEETGALYIVMELLEGTTLSRELRRRGALRVGRRARDRAPARARARRSARARASSTATSSRRTSSSRARGTWASR